MIDSSACMNEAKTRHVDGAIAADFKGCCNDSPLVCGRCHICLYYQLFVTFNLFSCVYQTWDRFTIIVNCEWRECNILLIFKTGLFSLLLSPLFQHDVLSFLQMTLLCHVMIGVTTCLENLEMSGNLTAVREMSWILLKVRECQGKTLLGKSCLKLLIVSCIFTSIQVFSRSLFCVKY